MAKAIGEGARTVQGIKVELKNYEAPEKLVNFDAILIGSPTYHHNMPVGFKNLFEEVAEKNLNLNGKIGSAFGSYGWSGEAPHMVIEIMKNKFEMDVVEPPLLIKYVPDMDGLEKCRELGKIIAEKLI